MHEAGDCFSLEHPIVSPVDLLDDVKELAGLLGVFAIVGVEAIGSTSGLAPVIGEKLWIWSAGIAGGTVLLGLIGLLIGKKSG